MLTRSSRKELDTHEIQELSQPTTSKWSEREQEKLLKLLKIYGHKDLQNISKELNTKSKEEIRKFIIAIHSEVRRNGDRDSTVSQWLKQSISETEKNKTVKYWDSLQIAQVVKFLSIDGLLESHPPPEKCGNIDFAAAYRLLHQCLQGYPIQPVNKATADFIIQCFGNVCNEAGNKKFVDEIRDFLKSKLSDNSIKEQGKASNKMTGENSQQDIGQSTQFHKKPVISYQRKRPPMNAPSPLDLPPVKILVEEKHEPDLDNVKSYSVALAGSNITNTVTVPIAPIKTLTPMEEAAFNLQKCIGFNPFCLPEALLVNQNVSS